MTPARRPGSRRKPEAKAASRRPKAAPSPAAAEHERVLLELRVHQEELRQQNDELRSTQIELEEARDRYSDLYDMAPLPYLTVNRAGMVLEANRTCELFLGLTQEALSRRPFSSLIVPAFRAAFRKSLVSRRGKSEAMALHLQMYGAAGPVPVELHVRPTTNNLFYTAIVDLGERERMEAERRALLVEAEVARAASAAKDQFLAGLSHELRTPLTPIVAAISGLEPELARGGLSVNQLRDLVGTIHRNLDYEVRLIDDLLDASRLSFGKLNLTRDILDLHEVIGDAVSMLASEAHRKGVALDVTLEAPWHHVDGDALRLRQVVWNLLRNAIKFTDAGGTIRVRSQSTRSLLRVEVKDTGVGIAAADLSRVFDRFAQTAQGARAGGLGLGLTIVHGIIEAHGGHVRAFSPGVGKGATFIIELAPVWPPARPLAQAAAEGQAPVSAGDVAPMPSLRILLVDDHEETADILGQLLRARGYEVTVTHSVKEAVEAGTRQHLDLLITDLGLPDGTGLDVLEQLKPRLARPAIALTGYGQREDLERSRAAGFACHLVKPVEFPALLRAIERVYSQS
jgi:PAS domain S-box-containing protein